LIQKGFGIILCEMITCEVELKFYFVHHQQEPFKDMQTFSIPQAVIDGKRPKYPADTNPDYESIMTQCWDADPSKRPSFSSLEKTFVELLKKLEHSENKL
jgi:hypothetical protein